MSIPNQPNKLVFLLFIIITFIGFMLWVGSLLFIWLILNIFNIKTEYWMMLEALSTAVAAVAVIAAGFIAYNELSEISKSRHIEIADRLFNELNSEENILSRRWIFQNLPDNPEEGIRTITIEGKAAIKQVLNSLDRVAFLTQTSWIPDEIIMPWMHPMIAKSYQKLEHYLEYERTRRNEPYYYINVSNLGKRCKIWREKNIIDSNINWIDNAL